METGRTESRFLHPRIALVFSLILLTACQFFGTSSPAAQEAVATPPLSMPPVVVTPVPSPQPTLSLAEKEALVLEYYTTNCKLPCLWGIVPGETEWQSVQSFFSTIATEISTSAESETDTYYSAEVYLPVPQEISSRGELVQYFIVNDGKVEIIDFVSPGGTNKVYTIFEILNTYGLPTEVKIDTYAYSFGEINLFHLALFYPDKNILVRYGTSANFIDEYVVGCFQSGNGSVVVWSSELDLSFAEALNGTRGLGTFGEQYYKALEEATEMDVETFYQTYLDPDTETCLETPAELWMDR